MKKILSLALAATSVVGIAKGEPTTLEQHQEKLAKVVKAHFPDATISTKAGVMSAKHGTMIFTVHGHNKTGRIDEKTYQREGPNYMGFIVSLSAREGAYAGAAAVPQTFDQRYWDQYFDCPETEDGKGHYVFRFSYGSRLDKKFKEAVFKAMPKRDL